MGGRNSVESRRSHRNAKSRRGLRPFSSSSMLVHAWFHLSYFRHGIATMAAGKAVICYTRLARRWFLTRQPLCLSSLPPLCISISPPSLFLLHASGDDRCSSFYLRSDCWSHSDWLPQVRQTYYFDFPLDLKTGVLAPEPDGLLTPAGPQVSSNSESAAAAALTMLSDRPRPLTACPLVRCWPSLRAFWTSRLAEAFL